MSKIEKTNESVAHAAIFQEKAIRRAWHNEEWWFVVTDVVAILSSSVNPNDYIKKMRLRDKELAQGWGQIVTPLRIETEGGNLGTPFGEQVAHAMRSGQVMILEGEEKGGSTATDEFFDVLSANFERLDAETLALNEHHRTFPGLHDRWQILRKK